MAVLVGPQLYKVDEMKNICLLISGLSVLQGGVVNVLTAWEGDGAHYKQLRKGLQRAGMWEVNLIVNLVYSLP